MDPSLYDEFGNYIGPEILEDSDLEIATEQSLRDGVWPDTDASMHNSRDNAGFGNRQFHHLRDNASMLDGSEAAAQAIVLHEDKEYYPSSMEVYGKDVETLVQDEDTQPLSVPIIAPPPKPASGGLLRAADPTEHVTTYDTKYLVSVSRIPELVRNVAFVGHIHHGKTSLIDLLVEQVHPYVKWDLERCNRYLDTHDLARQRGLSIKTSPISLLMSGLSATPRRRTHLLHIMDTPGHVDFVDECACALRLCDGAVLVVDVIEGVMANTERLLRRMVMERIPVCLVISKIDRLIMELKLPPNDAYLKICCVLEEINGVITSLLPNKADHDHWRLSPERNNVCFSSSEFGFCFSLASFAAIYADLHDKAIDFQNFALHLWGDIYHNPSTGGFSGTPHDALSPRTFVQFIMEPLYKIFAVVLGESADHIKQIFSSEFNIVIKKKELQMDVAPLLRLAMLRFFGAPTGLVDMIIHKIPNPSDNAKKWISKCYTGSLDDPVAKEMILCRSGSEPEDVHSTAEADSDARDDTALVIHIAKLYPNSEDDGATFNAFGRIVSGTVFKGQQIRVLGEGYSMEDEEDSTVATVSSLSLFQSRYSLPVDKMTAGNLVLLGGVAHGLVKTGTLVDARFAASLAIFAPLNHLSQSVVKVSIEPVQPSELPKMLDALRRVNKAYPLAITRVEESGEHILLGTGELYLDCVLHDLRRVFSGIEIKVSDPSAKFCETVSDISAFKCFAESPNKRNKLTMVAEPLDGRLAKEIEESTISLASETSIARLESEFGWDVLAARSMWAFGPEDRNGPNVLVNDTMVAYSENEDAQDQMRLLETVRDSIRQGFQWGAREGPLCDEPVRGVRFRLLDATLAAEPMHRGGGQLIPTARRLVHSCLLMASPRLMEPVYVTEIQTPADCIPAVYSVLARRRGHVLREAAKPGSPLYTVRAFLPVMDSFGFETDLRTHTQGQAFCQHVFDHYQVVPGNPLDRSIELRPLEPAPPSLIARDFMIKTRRRKGLSEEVSVGKYLDDPMLLELARETLGGQLGNFL